MAFNILEMRQKRAGLIQKARSEILDVAERDERDLTAEERQKYDEIMKEVDALGNRILLEEKQQKLETIFAKTVPENFDERAFSTRKFFETSEYHEAYGKFLRNGTKFLDEKETRMLIEGSDPKGGYLVPREFHETIIEALREQNFIRSLATVIDTMSDRDIPIDETDGNAYWEGEGEDDIESDESFKTVSLGAHKAVRMVKVSEELLDDSMFPLEPYISRKFARSIGALEESAFIAGNGVKKPLGLVASSQIGKITAANNAITSDELIEFFHSLKSQYRVRACFIMNDTTALVIRKLKNGTTGDYMWQPGLQANQPDLLLGRPVYTSSYMPTIAAGEKVILFGDISYYYIGQRGGFRFRRLDERYIDKGLVGFRGTERVDGKLTITEAVKCLQMKIS